jgi:hypothetical protein
LLWDDWPRRSGSICRSSVSETTSRNAMHLGESSYKSANAFRCVKAHFRCFRMKDFLGQDLSSDSMLRLIIINARCSGTRSLIAETDE